MAERPIPRFDPEQAASIRDGLRRREATRDRAALRGVDRIELSVVGPLEYEARNPHEPGGLMRVGEPAARGGTGTGNSPLSHFLAGAAACLLNQFVRISVAEGLPLDFSGASLRGEFRRDAGGAFERITCEVRASGRIPEADAVALIERAERLCYVSSTLAGAVELATVLVADGRELARRVTPRA